MEFDYKIFMLKNDIMNLMNNAKVPITILKMVNGEIQAYLEKETIIAINNQKTAFELSLMQDDKVEEPKEDAL